MLCLLKLSFVVNTETFYEYPSFRVLEGSDDGGSSWRVLDKQISQMFKNRFERRTYKIASVGFLANAFR